MNFKGLTLDQRINWRYEIGRRLKGQSAIKALISWSADGVLYLSDMTYKVTGRSLFANACRHPCRTGYHL